VEVLVDPKALSDRNLSLNDAHCLSNSMCVSSGAVLSLGRREYQVRTVSRSQS